MKRVTLLLLTSAMLAYLAGCAEAPTKAPLPGAKIEPAPTLLPPPTAAAPSAPPAPTALAAEEKGDYLAAAREYSQLATQNAQPLKGYYSLKMAENLLRGGFTDPARSALQELEEGQLTPELKLQRRLLLAHIAQLDRQPKRILELLAAKPDNTVSAPLQRQYHELRALAFEMLGNNFEYARARINLDPLLEDKAERARNHDLVWQALSRINDQLLVRLPTEPPPSETTGWLQLVHIAKAYLDHPQQMKEQLQIWRQNFPQHPANADIYVTLQERKERQPIKLHQIGVLLPLSGRYASAGNAIREGMLAAYYRAKPAATAQRLRFYDTAQGTPIPQLYEQAVTEGASVIIGPLQKAEVNELVAKADLNVPTITLNYADGDADEDNLFQFSLLPEDEVRQVADRVWQDGYNNVAIITQEGAWGDRLVTAFQGTWDRHANTNMHVFRYTPGTESITDSVMKVLSIDNSKQRISSLRQIIGRGIKYTERRRKDIDVILVAGISHTEASQVRPQLKYYGAEDTPVYSTSHIYSKNIEPRMARDLDGIIFSDMPWMVDATTRFTSVHNDLDKTFNIGTSANIRLYALGVDVYGLLPVLSTLQYSPYDRYEGASGFLYVDKQRHILRQLEWAYFDQGKALPINEMMMSPQAK